MSRERSCADGESATVAVVLPTYERGSVIGNAIESVLEQTYEDVELLIVDGGSTDRTPTVVESFSDPRLRYYRREEPSGVSAARNLGVGETESEFVAFIDSDDWWHEEKLERQVTALRGAGPERAAAYAGIQKEFGEPRTRSGTSGDVEAAVRRMEVPTYTSTLLVRRAAFEAVEGFDEGLRCFEDWDLCLRLSADYEFHYLDGPLVTKGTAGDNVSAEPDRLADATRRLRRKHDLPGGTVARLLADVGVTYCEAGRLDEGRSYLRESLRVDPKLDAALALLFAIPDSPETFGALKRRKDSLERAVARLRA